MRETEFWRRLDKALGPGYAHTWANSVVIAELDGRTVVEALAAGMPALQIWRAVWRMLELPPRDR